MRKIPKLNCAEYTKKEFELKDFSKYTKSCSGLEPSENGLQVLEISQFQSIASIDGLNVVKLYFVKDKLYFYLDNGEIGCRENGEWRTIGSSNVEPYLMSFKLNEQEGVLIVGESTIMAYDDGSILELSLPYGKSATLYKNMLFVANGNKIFFSKLFDYQNFTGGLNNSGFLITDESDGEILALIPRKSYLAVVCKRAIYHIIALGDREDYSLIKQDVALEVKDNSVKDGGDCIYLFNKNTFCKYKNGNLSKVDCNLKSDLSFDGQSGIDVNTYYAKLIDGNGDSYLFTYNGITDRSNLLPSNIELISDGGYFTLDGAVQKTGKSVQVNGVSSWQSVELDFDYPLVKSLVGIEVKTNQSFSMELEYSYGKQTLKFDVGLSLKEVHVIDRKFKVRLDFDSSSVSLEQIKFIYRLQEK